MSYAIETKNLSKIYKNDGKKIAAVTDLNLSVKKGSIYGFIGPNGAGKTTAIKLIMGMVWPTSGSLTVLNEEPGSVGAKNKIGYLSEIAYYYTFMEAENLLKYYGSIRGIDKQECVRRIDENLKLVGLADRKNQKLKNFSKGMLQRFGIALALLGEPELLVLDEPTSGLDPIGRKEVKDIIRTLKTKGITIFLSSHNLSEVEKICDDIGIINKGKMIENKSLDKFLDYDKKIYTIRFKAPDPKLTDALSSNNISIAKEEDDVLRTTVTENDFTKIFSLINENSGIIVEILPGYGSLEEIFFKLITSEGVK